MLFSAFGGRSALAGEAGSLVACAWLVVATGGDELALALVGQVNQGHFKGHFRSISKRMWIINFSHTLSTIFSFFVSFFLFFSAYLLFPHPSPLWPSEK